MNVILLRSSLLVAAVFINIEGLVLVQYSFTSILALGTFIMFLGVGIHQYFSF